jgi:hypothetical protein
MFWAVSLGFSQSHHRDADILFYIKIDMGGACSAYGEGRGVNRAMVGKTEGRRQLGGPSRRWEDNIKMEIQEVRCGGTDWIELVHDRDRWRALVTAVMNIRVP